MMITETELGRLISCIDLTRLNPEDTPEHIFKLCQQAVTPFGSVAAVCVYPAFVSLAWQRLIETPVKVATVANFPAGDETLEKITHTFQQAILDGAAEIDVVIPSHAAHPKIGHFINYCKKLCGKNILLKIILETGNKSLEEINTLSQIAIAQGADFLKTSTGKIPIGATPEAAKIILESIKTSQHPIGFKASGGIKTLENAKTYVNLVKTILGPEAFHPARFRIGASSLLEEIICAFQNLN